MRRPLARGWMRLGLWLVPREWRDTVTRDLGDEAERLGRSDFWIGTQAALAGLNLRGTLTGAAVWTDLRYAVRSLAQARWFTIGAVLTFALGIGVNVAVFSAVDRMLFRALPYDRPEDLVVMREFSADLSRHYGTLGMSYFDGVRTLDAVVDASQSGWNGQAFTDAAEPGDEPTMQLSQVSYNALSVLGVRPYVGRDFTKADVDGRHRAALLSYELWQNRFAGRTDILGHTIWHAGESTEVVGILPPRFINATNYLDPRSDGVFLDFAALTATNPRARAVPPIIRLKSGVSLAVAQAQVDAMVARLRAGEPAPAGRLPSMMRLDRLDHVLFGAYFSYLWLVVAASALVFLVACANLSSLMLVRGRSRELRYAVCLALGASRGRLIRGGLIEAGCLAVGGAAVAAVGLVLAGRALELVLPPMFSQYSAGLSDTRVLVALVACAGLGALVAGLVPGLRAGRVDVHTALQQQAGRGNSRRLGGRSLLVMEAAVSVLLVAGAAATSRSLVLSMRTDLGFDPAGLYDVAVFLPPLQDPRANLNQYLQAAGALRRVNGIGTVAVANALPVYDQRPERLVPGRDSGSRYRVGAGLLETVGARLLAGRLITADEVSSHAPVGVMNVSAVRGIWPDLSPEQAVGRLLTSDGEAPILIVGVVADMRSSPIGSAQELLFVPIDATDFRFLSYVAHTVDGKRPSVVAVRRALTAAGLTPRSVAVNDVAAGVASSLQDDRFRAALFLSFAVAALVLAVTGLYATASFEAALRRRELGVRLALGATPISVARLLVVGAVRPVLVGACVGLVVTYWAAPYIQSFLRQVDARDAATLAGVVGVLVIASVLAAWVPARRAARTDPAVELRAD